MARSKSPSAQDASGQTIEQLQKRYQDLNTQKIQAARDLEHANTQLDALRKEAREKYGTDNLAELQDKLQAMKADNEAKRQKYQTDLEAIESALAAVETQFAGADETEEKEQA
jgi:hypothetical protein